MVYSWIFFVYSSSIGWLASRAGLSGTLALGWPRRGSARIAGINHQRVFMALNVASCALTHHLRPGDDQSQVVRLIAGAELLHAVKIAVTTCSTGRRLVSRKSSSKRDSPNSSSPRIASVTPSLKIARRSPGSSSNLARHALPLLKQPDDRRRGFQPVHASVRAQQHGRVMAAIHIGQAARRRHRRGRRRAWRNVARPWTSTGSGSPVAGSRRDRAASSAPLRRA